MASAPWTSRSLHQVVSCRGQLWIIGGKTLQGEKLRDVWSSTDGTSWTLRDWIPGLDPGYAAVVHGGKIFLIGRVRREVGWPAPPGVYYYVSEVYSYDPFFWWQGWRKVVEAPPFLPRVGLTAVSAGGKIWIMGGQNEDYGNLNDVWYSSNGRDWKQATANAPWSPRAWHAAAVHDDAIFVLGGDRGYEGHRVPLNDIWYSPIETAAAGVWYKYR